jgi:hypothetical protein
MKRYDTTPQDVPDPKIGENDFYFPVLQYKGGKGPVVWPEDWKEADFVVVNGENAAGGFGINPETAGKLYSYGVDCITSGNHIWRNKDVFTLIEGDHRLVRPANYPNGTSGKIFLMFSSILSWSLSGTHPAAAADSTSFGRRLGQLGPNEL